MKKLVRKILVVLVLTISVATVSAQVRTVQIDTARIAAGKKVTAGDNAGAGSGNINQGQSGKSAANSQANSVKPVQSSRPDMSKAKGARPPVIGRPGGSGIPKGVGRPAGAGKKGGR